MFPSWRAGALTVPVTLASGDMMQRDTRTPETMKEELYDEIEMPDGSTELIPQQDQVQPTFGNFLTETTVAIQQRRLKMSQSGMCTATVTAPKRSIEDPYTYGSIYAEISGGRDVDDVYAEITFENVEQIKRLRDTLNMILRYRGEE